MINVDLDEMVEINNLKVNFLQRIDSSTFEDDQDVGERREVFWIPNLSLWRAASQEKGFGNQ